MSDRKQVSKKSPKSQFGCLLGLNAEKNCPKFRLKEMFCPIYSVESSGSGCSSGSVSGSGSVSVSGSLSGSGSFSGFCASASFWTTSSIFSLIFEISPETSASFALWAVISALSADFVSTRFRNSSVEAAVLFFAVSRAISRASIF